VLVTFYNSLHTLRMDLGMQYEYVGLEHFREILTTDAVFWKAARNSLVWAVVAPLVDLPLAFVLALTLHARVPFARFFRTVWFTPVLMSYPVVGVIWLWVYNYDWGIANLVLRAVGLHLHVEVERDVDQRALTTCGASPRRVVRHHEVHCPTVGIVAPARKTDEPSDRGTTLNDG